MPLSRLCLKGGSLPENSPVDATEEHFKRAKEQTSQSAKLE